MKAEGTEGNEVRTEKNNEKITEYKKKVWRKKRIRKTGWWGLCKLGGGCGADETRERRKWNRASRSLN